MKKIFSSPIVPRFARLPLTIVVIFNFVTYYLTRIITADATHYNLSVGIDKVIPFCPIFIIFYVGAYIQWVHGYIYHCKQSKELCNQIAASDLIAKAICFLCFIILPTTIVRPEITGTSIFDKCVKLIYSADLPVNLFPSVHCLESWICFRGALKMKLSVCEGYGLKDAIRDPYIIFQFIFTLLVFASTVFIKQHFFVDIIGGIAAVEIGWLITTLTGDHVKQQEKNLFRQRKK